MGLLERVNHRAAIRGHEQRRQTTGPQLNLDDLMAFFNGLGYPFVQTTMSQVDREQIPYSAVGAHNANSAVFSLTLARVQAFSQIRFQWTRFQGTVAQDLFGSPELAVLEKPWPGGRTPHLLARMEIDNAIAGNAFVVRPRPDRLSRLRPDQVTIILGSQTDADFPADAPDVEVAGWYYLPRSGVPKIFLPHQVAHYAPLPDPQFTFLGMSWITAAMREIQGDSLMTEHKVRFLENAATPNLAIKFDPAVGIDAVRQFKELMEAEHKGAWNAYKTLYLGGGAEPVAVGRDFQQLDFRQVQGKGESRLAAAAGVPPSWVGFSEGLQGSSLNAGNFTAARRRFTDGPQPLNARVLTPRGWSTMGELQRGWKTIGSDGLPHMILDTFDQGIQDVYRVTFGDGTAVECTEGHYWKVRDRERRRRGWEVLPLADICDVGLRRGERAPRWAVPLTQPVVHAAWHKPLPVDPYLLGLLLGDGTFVDTVRLTVGRDDADEVEKRVVSECLQPGLTVRREDRKDCSVLYLIGGQGTFKDRRMATMPTLMRRLGLWNVTTQQKYIPRLYLYAGLEQRVALLQGLLDSDGCVTQDGTLRFANTSPMLIRDTMDLARSLGAACWVRAEYGNTQELAISRLPAGITPVRLQRKQARLRERFGVHQWQRAKSIVSVEKVRRAETRCIKVDAVDSLYVTDGFTLTHNTMSDLWTHAACALETILTPPDSGAALWYDTRGIPFMHEDGRDQAAIQSEQAQTITKLVREGFTPTSVIKAVTSNDWTALVHTGLTSVQLQPPSSGQEPMPGEAPAGAPAVPAANGSSNGKAAAASNGQGGG